jgi:hypothetical protein
MKYLEVLDDPATEWLVPRHEDLEKRTGTIACKFPFSEDLIKDGPYSLFAFYDTETTGFDFESEDIISIACIMMLSYRVCCNDVYKWKFIEIGRFHTYIFTAKPIPVDAFRIHGISNEILARNGAKTFEDSSPAPLLHEAIELWARWIKWMKIVPEDRYKRVHRTVKDKSSFVRVKVQNEDTVYLGGHNSWRFDDPMLYCNMSRVVPAMEPWMKKHGYEGEFDMEVWMRHCKVAGSFDTLKLVRTWASKPIMPVEMKPRLPDTNEELVDFGKVCWKLGHFYRRWTGQPVENAHDALYDCWMLSQIWQTDMTTQMFDRIEFLKLLYSLSKMVDNSISQMSIKTIRRINKIKADAHLPSYDDESGSHPEIEGDMCLYCCSFVAKKDEDNHRCDAPKIYRAPKTETPATNPTESGT